MEQDPHDFGGDLPTYNDLAAQNGPNSRFGRWKGWVEKRAAERYAEDTPESREARRLRGWGPPVDTQTPETSFTISPQLTPSDIGLHRTQTVLSNPPCPDEDREPLSTPHVTAGQALPPSHLKLHSFGSRFLPHSEQPILSCLPLFDHQKLLLGHADGLSLLDMTPEAQSSDVASLEPRRRDIWYGEGVYQMAILEHEQPSASSTPVGVVLALVGAEPPDGASDKETVGPHKTIRMYNLASLASLVRWTATRQSHVPLDRSRLGSSQPSPKKHKSHLSISRVFTSSGAPTTSNQPPDVPPRPPPKDWPRPSSISRATAPDRGGTLDTWDHICDDDIVPLQWATDFVPLASPSSRLANHSVLLFELYKIVDRGRVTAHLAVATRQSILLYETVRGERAFRFVKEFYTPVPARSVTFVNQNSNETLMRTLSPSTPRPLSLGNAISDTVSRRASSPLPVMIPQAPSQTGQLSLFVTFEKKAGIIRISDSSVGELELWEEPGQARRASIMPSPSGSFRRSLHSPESAPGGKDLKGPWAPPAEAALPLGRTMPAPRDAAAATQAVYLLTRGRATHIVRAPLPVPLALHAPLAVLTWGMRPTRVVPRVCEHPASGAPFLQVAALGADGVEVQELGLAFAARAHAHAHGKAREDARVVVQADVGPGGAGFLCMGGHWTEALRPALQRQGSAHTVDTLDTLDLAARRARAVGFYAWARYAINDWRVFWLGGDVDDGEAPPTSP